MSTYKCKTCGGEYDDTSGNHYEYYHACPPVLNEKNEYVEREDKRDENAGINKEGKGRDEVEK